MSRRHATHDFLRAHSALAAVEAVRLERVSGSKWFEPQLEMIECNNPNAWVQSSACTVLSGGGRRRVDSVRHPSSVGRDFSPSWTQPSARRQNAAGGILVKISLPTVPLLSLFHCYWSGKAWRALPSGRASKEEKGVCGAGCQRVAGFISDPGGPSRGQKVVLFPNPFIPRHPCQVGKLG